MEELRSDPVHSARAGALRLPPLLLGKHTPHLLLPRQVLLFPLLLFVFTLTPLETVTPFPPRLEQLAKFTRSEYWLSRHRVLVGTVRVTLQYQAKPLPSLALPPKPTKQVGS